VELEVRAEFVFGVQVVKRGSHFLLDLLRTNFFLAGAGCTPEEVGPWGGVLP